MKSYRFWYKLAKGLIIVIILIIILIKTDLLADLVDDAAFLKIKHSRLVDELYEVKNARSHNLRYNLIYKVVFGSINSNDVVLWVTKDKYYDENWTIHFKLNVDNILSKDKMEEIIADNYPLLNINYSDLIYVDMKTVQLSKGVYWMGLNGSNRVYINVTTGEVIEITH